MKTQKRAFMGQAALLGASLLWGTSFVILKQTLENVGTLWVLAVRFTLAAMLFGAFAGKRLRRLSPRQLSAGNLR